MGHASLNWALKYVKAPIVSVSVLGESVGASLLAFLIFREALAWYQMVGGLFILMGIYVAATREKTPAPRRRRRSHVKITGVPWGRCL